MIIGHGCPNRQTDARKGMKATELLSFAKGTRAMGKNQESQAIARSVKARRPFQNREFCESGTCHSGATNTARAPAEMQASRIRKRGRVSCRFLSLTLNGPRCIHRGKNEGTPW